MKTEILLSAVMALSGCTTAMLQTTDGFDRVALGSSRDNVEEIYGAATMEGYEQPDIPFKVLSYGQQEKEVSFTFDPTGTRLIGKSKSIPKQPSFKLGTKMIRLDDPGFKRMRPCHTWSDEDALLMNPESGVFVAISNSPHMLVAEELPELMQFRINGLYKKCPRLQPPRSP